MISIMIKKIITQSNTLMDFYSGLLVLRMYIIPLPLVRAAVKYIGLESIISCIMR